MSNNFSCLFLPNGFCCPKNCYSTCDRTLVKVLSWSPPPLGPMSQFGFQGLFFFKVGFVLNTSSTFRKSYLSNTFSCPFLPNGFLLPLKLLFQMGSHISAKSQHLEKSFISSYLIFSKLLLILVTAKLHHCIDLLPLDAKSCQVVFP